MCLCSLSLHAYGDTGYMVTLQCKWVKIVRIFDCLASEMRILYEGCTNSKNWSNKNIGWNREEWYFIVGSLLSLSLSVCVHTGSHSITGSTFACAIWAFFPLKLTDDSDLQIFAMHFNNMCKQVNVIEYILVPISKWATVISYNFAFIGLEFTCFSMLLLWLMNYCKR